MKLLGIFQQGREHRQGAVEPGLVRACTVVAPADDVGGNDVRNADGAEHRCEVEPPRIAVARGGRWLPVSRYVGPVGLDVIGQLRRRFRDGTLGQAVQRDLREKPPCLGRGKRRVQLIATAQRDPPVLAAMPKPDELVIAPGRVNSQPEAGQLGIPDAVFRRLNGVLPPGEITIEQCPATGLSPVWDHKAIMHTRTEVKSRGNVRICWDHIAIRSIDAAEPRQHLLH
jgi:hypothetical protein